MKDRKSGGEVIDAEECPAGRHGGSDHEEKQCENVYREFFLFIY